MNKEKPFYKSFKFQVMFIAVVLSILLGTVGQSWTQHTLDLIISIVALALTVIFGHAYTDAKAAIAGLVMKGDKEKPFYKKKKFMIAAGATILNVVIGIFGEKMSPNITELIYSITALGMSVIGGHSYTDAKSLLSENVSKKSVG